MDRFARAVLLHRRVVLLIALLFIAIFGVVGAGVASQLKGGGFDDPNSPSSRAEQVLGQQFDVHNNNLLLLVRAKAGLSVDSPAVVDQARSAASQLASQPDVTVQASYFSATGPAAAGLRSRDQREGLIVAYVAGSSDDARAIGAQLTSKFRQGTAVADIIPGGGVIADADITDQVTKDLAVAESIAIPATLLLLILAFGGVIAGLLPLMVGGASILGTFFALSIIARFTDVSIFALNLTTALGLGLGIDYSLLIVSRFREELAKQGVSPFDAARLTLRTAGRTVAFSAATVAVSLSALLVFPLFFLRSFAYAGIAVVAVSAAGALVLLPAVLVMLGHRVNKWSLPFARGRGRSAGAPSPFWARTASIVMRRPVIVGLSVSIALLAMATPFLHAHWGLPDDRVLSTQAHSRTVGDAVRNDFVARASDEISIAVSSVSPENRAAAISAYASQLSKLPDVALVQSEAGSYLGGSQVSAQPSDFSAGSSTRLIITPKVSAYSDAARTLIHSIRDVPAPGSALVGGYSAALVDTLHSVGGALPLAAAIIVIASLVILFLFTGSILLPIKALVLNILSLGSVLGVVVWVFQYGHGSTVLNFTPQPLAIAMPLLLFCVAFGLSMDYEVFLLGRIKEQHDRGDSTTEAVVAGLARTGGIVSTAAALLAVTFLAFLTSKVSFIQLFGLGTGLAIIVDATLVRGLLVPAFMRLVGEANWWAPPVLRRLHNRIGLSEQEEAQPPQPQRTTSESMAG